MKMEVTDVVIALLVLFQVIQLAKSRPVNEIEATPKFDSQSSDNNDENEVRTLVMEELFKAAAATPEGEKILSRTKRDFGPCRQYLFRLRNAPNIKIARFIMRAGRGHMCGRRKFNFTKELTRLGCAKGFLACS